MSPSERILLSKKITIKLSLCSYIYKTPKSPPTPKLTHNTHFDPFSDQIPTQQKLPKNNPKFDPQIIGVIDIQSEGWN